MYLGEPNGDNFEGKYYTAIGEPPITEEFELTDTLCNCRTEEYLLLGWTIN
jgi:hypothetical protein